MSLSERLFEAITQFPTWLESFDNLQIPGWGVLLALGVATVGLIFAIREFLSWFLKTNSIIDEVVRLETMVRDLKGDLAALEATVERLQAATGDVAGTVTSTIQEAAALEASAQLGTARTKEKAAASATAFKEPSFSSSATAAPEKSKPQFRLDY